MTADGRPGDGPTPGPPPPVVVLGLPRSGTTWTAHLLACAPGTVAVLEPDNEKTQVAAVEAKAGVGRFPVLRPGDDAEAYARLWAWALHGAEPTAAQRLAGRLFHRADPGQLEALAAGRPSPRLRLAGRLARPPRAVAGSEGSGRRVVAKSVHAPLAAEWLADRLAVSVVVVLRHPANVLASWLALDLPDRDRHLETVTAVREHYLERWDVAPPGRGAGALDRAVWQLGLLTAALEEAADGHPQWLVRRHEELCARPEDEFRRLYQALDLVWTDRAGQELAASDRPGEGFSLTRRAADLADGWRRRLGPEEVAALRRGLAPFPLRRWRPGDLGDDACAG